MAQFSLKTKINSIVALGILASATATALLVGTTHLQQNASSVQQQVSDDLNFLSQTYNATNTAALAAMDAIVDADSRKVASDLNEEVKSSADVTTLNRERLRSLFLTYTSEEEWKTFETNRNDFFGQIHALFEAIPRSITPEQTTQYDDRIDGLAVNLKSSIEKMRENMDSQAKQRLKKAVEQSDFVRHLSIIACIIAVTTLIVLGLRISQQTSTQLRETSGDLSLGAKSLESISKTLFESSKTLSAMTTQTGASLDETTQATASLNDMVERTLSAVDQSVRISKDSDQQVIEGQSAIKRVVEQMSEVRSISQELHAFSALLETMDAKLQVINNIVIKTQLLSFNASIESARAGEHGKRFAVVADEVANLAKLSGDSALEIFDLVKKSREKVESVISNTQDRINQSDSVVINAQKKLSELMGSVHLIKEQVGAIQTVALDQAHGIKQINSAMQEMQIAARNAEKQAEELSSTSKRVNELQTNVQTSTLKLEQMVCGSDSAGEKLPHAV